MILALSFPTLFRALIGAAAAVALGNAALRDQLAVLQRSGR
jgi:hypothetical protein